MRTVAFLCSIVAGFYCYIFSTHAMQPLLTGARRMEAVCVGWSMVVFWGMLTLLGLYLAFRPRRYVGTCYKCAGEVYSPFCITYVRTGMGLKPFCEECCKELKL